MEVLSKAMLTVLFLKSQAGNSEAHEVHLPHGSFSVRYVSISGMGLDWIALTTSFRVIGSLYSVVVGVQCTVVRLSVLINLLFLFSLDLFLALDLSRKMFLKLNSLTAEDMLMASFQSLFISGPSTSMKTFDQIFAPCGGCITFLFP